MKKPATAQRRRRKRVPRMRFKLDGEWWTVRIERPPSKELCEGICHYKRRTIYFHPRALKTNMLGIIAHELAHCVFPIVDETHIRDFERVTSVVARWASKYTDGQISIGQHRRDK
jgi:hypothetical protein